MGTHVEEIRGSRAWNGFVRQHDELHTELLDWYLGMPLSVRLAVATMAMSHADAAKPNTTDKMLYGLATYGFLCLAMAGEPLEAERKDEAGEDLPEDPQKGQES